jgi:1,4-alpha-glucan branching enzyme
MRHDIRSETPRAPRLAPRALRASIAVTPVLAVALLGLGGCGEATREASGPPGSAGTVLADGGVPSLDGGPGGDAAGTGSVDAGARDAALPPPPSGVPTGGNTYPGGTEFRVWAPNAKAVAVVGPFAPAPVLLAPEPDGRFAAKVAGAHAGQTYHYLVTAADGSILTRVDPRARQSQGAESVIVDPAAYAWQTPPFTPAARAESVVYELHVGSFAPPGAGGSATGTFASVAQKLDYLRDLGVTAVELMPVTEFPGGASWGYNPTGLYAPKPVYGAPDDLRRLVDAAHARGIGVLLDVVYNHYDGGNAAPLRCWDGACNGTHGIYFFGPGAYESTPWGPRPDFGRAEVRDFLVDDVFMWMSEYRVDGFRFDSTSNIRGLDGQGTVPGGSDFLRRACDVAHAWSPRALMIAEDLKGYAPLTQTTASGGLGFDAQWDGFGYDVAATVIGADDTARSMATLAGALTRSYDGDPFDRVLFTENHDFVGNGSARLPQRIDPGNPGSWAARKRSMLAAALLLTTPGVPMLFEGQEILEPGAFPNPPAALAWSKATTFAPVLAYYRDLIRLRRNLDGVSAGLTGASIDVRVNEAAKVLVVRRWSTSASGGKANDDVVIVASFANRSFARYEIGLPADGTWHVRLDGDAKRYSSDFGGGSLADVVAAAPGLDGSPVRGAVTLAPYSVVVLSR